eukprot:COSAG06_NODE_2315_length_7095_cov_2.522870_5_plen_181_part_00
MEQHDGASSHRVATVKVAHVALCCSSGTWPTPMPTRRTPLRSASPRCPFRRGERRACHCGGIPFPTCMTPRVSKAPSKGTATSTTVAHRHGARFARGLRRPALACGQMAHTRAARARARGGRWWSGNVALCPHRAHRGCDSVLDPLIHSIFNLARGLARGGEPSIRRGPDTHTLTPPSAR